MMKEDCIFCKIAAGEIPSGTIYEDEDFRVIFDINPASFGHAIIIPKQHAQDVYSLPEEMAGKVFIVAKKVAQALQEALGCDGINILQNNGEAAGQSVFHFHMHVIPRYQGDSVNIKWKPGTAEETKLEELMKKLEIR